MKHSIEMLQVYITIIVLPLLVLGVFSADSDSKDLFNKFHQNDYHIKHERSELVSYNKDYVSHAQIRSFKYNRTVAAENATFTLKYDFGKDLMVTGQVYKFMSNEYRYFPIRMQLKICDIANNNILGAGTYKNCGNITGCPLKKGTYVVCNYVADESGFPPLIPSGKYMIEFQGTNHGTEIFVSRSYGSVIKPFD